MATFSVSWVLFFIIRSIDRHSSASVADYQQRTSDAHKYIGTENLLSVPHGRIHNHNQLQSKICVQHQFHILQIFSLFRDNRFRQICHRLAPRKYAIIGLNASFLYLALLAPVRCDDHRSIDGCPEQEPGGGGGARGHWNRMAAVVDIDCTANNAPPNMS